MKHPKHADTDHPVEAILSQRWSPYCYADKDVSKADLLSIFEAARWAASAYNEQPWRYILACRSDPAAFQKLLSCLVEGNQGWAQHAPVLVVSVALLNFSHNGKQNMTALHDLGLAAGNICVESTARGLYVHQMSGILPERVRELYNVPAEAAPLTAFTLGYLGEGDNLPADVKMRDRSPRSRHPITSLVFGTAWSQAADFDQR